MKWTTLRHNGVAFPPEYDYRHLTVKIKGEPFQPNPEQEEMLMAWAKKKDTPYVQDSVFQQNFLGDLKKILPEHYANITLSDIDWSEMHAIADREKTVNLSPEEKKKRSEERKKVRDELKANFGTAVIDETESEIGAYMVEPPGILMGRGAHPLRGKWKKRVEPENVILNLDENATVPPAPQGHQWGKIVHEHDSMWIASWYDDLSDKRKYVWLADSSNLRQERDKEKYVKAQKLETGLSRVREAIRKGMNYSDPRINSLEKKERKLREEIAALERRVLQASGAGDKEGRRKAEDALGTSRRELERVEKQRERYHLAAMKRRQIATTCYLIDRLAMRVGDEKDEDEADTVGASTLRVEHVKAANDKIEFDFLGKDSVQWQKTITLSENEQVLARNLQEFMLGKAPGEQIFDKIDSTHVNRFLSEALPGLTAKVFRTYHATTTVRDCLRENDQFAPDAPMFEKEFTAKWANLQAAITCNHKRTPPKNWEENLAKKAEAVEKLTAIPLDLAKFDKERETREKALKKLLDDQKKLAVSGPKAIQQKKDALEKLQAESVPEADKDRAKHAKELEKREKAVQQAEVDFEKRQQRLNERIAKAQEAVDKARQAPERAQREHAERIARAKRQLELAKMTRDYNLGTSLKNYIDPRIYRAWGDHVGYDWKRLYTKALQRKFAWVNQSRAKWNSSSDIEDVVDPEHKEDEGPRTED